MTRRCACARTSTPCARGERDREVVLKPVRQFLTVTAVGFAVIGLTTAGLALADAGLPAPPAYGTTDAPPDPPATEPTPAEPTPAEPTPTVPTPGAAPSAPSTADVAALQRTNRVLRAQLRTERRRAERAQATLRRRLTMSPSVRHALRVASAAYGVSTARLTRVATCESTLNPSAGNGPYLGLFQFGARLWATTPYRDFPRTDPYAASLAASWALARGMDAHWPVCGTR